MAEEKIKIGDLPAADTVGTGDTFPIVQAGVTKKATVSQLPVPTSVVKTTGDQTIAGVKTFSSPPVVPAASAAGNPVRKQEFDTADAQNVKLTGLQDISGRKRFIEKIEATRAANTSEYIADILASSKVANGLLARIGAVAGFSNGLSILVNATNDGLIYDFNEGPIRARSGVLFGSDSAAANTLDDYEEGTWTVTSPDLTFAYQTGIYTVIGDMVFVQIELVFPATANTNNARFSLPILPISANIAGGLSPIYGTSAVITKSAALAGGGNIYATLFNLETGAEVKNNELSTRYLYLTGSYKKP